MCTQRKSEKDGWLSVETQRGDNGFYTSLSLSHMQFIFFFLLFNTFSFDIHFFMKLRSLRSDLQFLTFLLRKIRKLGFFS